MNTPTTRIPSATARGKALLLVGGIFAIIVGFVALFDTISSGLEGSLSILGYLFALVLFIAAIMGIANCKKTEKGSMQSINWLVSISAALWVDWVTPYTQNLFQTYGGIDFSVVLFIVPHCLLWAGASKNNKNV